jgi:group I intron endonuclease
MADAILAQSGIYAITNKINGKRYVGSAVNLKKRASTHWRELRNKCHTNDRLQNAYNKYGAESFCFSVIEVVANRDDLLAREQFWIDSWQSSDKTIGYNIAHIAGPSMAGRKHTAESKKKMSVAGSGKVIPPDVRKRMSDAKLGKIVSPETRAKLSAWRMGSKSSAETIARMVATRAGYRHSPETIARMTGKIATKETCAKISASLQGRVISAQHRAKLSAANIGISRGPQPPDVIAKRVAATRATKLAKALCENISTASS